MGSEKTMRKKRSAWMVVVTVSVLLAFAGVIRAQDAPPASSTWHYELDLFAWGSGLSGDVGPASKEYQLHASFADLTEVLDFAAMGHFEVRKEKWGFMADAFYVNLGHSVDNRLGLPVKLNLEETILGMAGSYRLYQGPRALFDLTFGARYNEVKTGITPTLMPPMDHSISWTDPVIGVKGGVKMSKAWTFGYRADVGGFGAGSRLTWLGVLQFGAQLSQHTSLNFGYISYGVDYEKGSGARQFVYDMTTSGPFLGVSFKW